MHNCLIFLMAFAMFWLPPMFLSATEFREESFVSKVRYQSKNLAAKYWIGSPKASTDGLLFYFHGDGGSSGVQQQLLRLAPVASENRLAIAGAATPIGNSWYGVVEPKTPEHPFPTAQFFDEMLKAILSKHHVDRGRVFLTGISGGAVFITGRYLPRYGAGYRGGAVLLCGGSATDTYTNGKEIYLNPPEFRANFPMYFFTMKGDYLYQQILEGTKSYRDAGFSVLSKFPDGGGHCSFSINDQLAAGLQSLRALPLRP
jgi:hypothetical protein